ncbi:universal stress protein [Psychroserpens mesophilus]|uniref:universal stress protein n=1 Tax=Psychroserpens mesophilus TaxID=325473 RepID=UPI003D65F380
MKKILIPTNFSLNSYHTIDYVTKLFTNEYCEFYFFNSYSYGMSGLNAIELLQADDEWFDKPKIDSLKQLGRLVEKYTLKSKNSKHVFHAICEHSNLVHGLKNTVEKLDIDIVILSSRAEKTIGKTTTNVLKEIRSCPILIVPPNAPVSKGVHLTIASDFKQKINTNEINKFCKALVNTNFEIGILVLETQHSLSAEAAINLETLIVHVKQYLIQPIDIEFVQSSNHLKDYAMSHLTDIMCVIDKKPDVFRKIGLYKSKVISKLEQLRANTVLTIHQ